MISGLVREGEARIRLKIRGTRGREQEIEAVIDTGYSASLTLPPQLVAQLGLRWQSVNRVTLADGSETLFDVYQATLTWDRRERRILVDEADSAPLVGMALLSGYELNIQVRHRGKVTIRRMP